MAHKPTFYITTPIYYPSAKLHIGHAYSTTMADTMARYKRLRGFDTFFLTGSDEHGQKIQRAALAENKKPLEYLDPIVSSFQELWKALHIENDDFIRTTEPRHEKAVQEIFKRIYDKGDIYLSSYEGHYCTSCETFFTERQLQEGGTCPDCGKKTEVVKEESYFFRMSKYEKPLLDYIHTHPEFIQPAARRNEMIAFIEQGLEDLSISRTSFDWGIPVPLNDEHVIYVWFDALTNYMSALGWPNEDDPRFQKFWPADVHLVGKDIARFHAIIWPIILMAADLPLPKTIAAHGWILLGGGKMSKSKGNVVDPFQLIEKYGADALRYYILREFSFGNDGDYAEINLLQRINTDLANDYGNLLSRTVAMIDKYRGGVLPAAKKETAFDKDLQKTAKEATETYANAMDQFQFSHALEGLWKLVTRANKYIDETTPWILAKDESRADELDTVLYNLAEALRVVTICLTPAMPTIAARVGEQLGFDFKDATWEDATTWGLLPSGLHVQKKDALFPRIDPATLDVAESIEEETAEADTPTFKPEITYDDFQKLDLRVAEVLACVPVEKADRLLQFTLNVGGETRTVLSGIRKFYDNPEALVGKKVVLLANLAPRKIRGIESCGMILSAAEEDDSVLEMLTITRDIQPGASIS